MRKSYSEHPLCLHDNFDGSKVTFGVYLAPECDYDNEPLNDAFDAWSEGEDVELNFRFSVSGCLESMIEMHRYTNEPGEVVSEEDRASFAALRSELAEAIRRIDALRYIKDEADCDKAQS